jgi:hypothetical protein
VTTGEFQVLYVFDLFAILTSSNQSQLLVANAMGVFEETVLLSGDGWEMQLEMREDLTRRTALSING